MRWRAAIADEELRRAFAEPDFDDAGWEPVAVPGHWRSVPAFDDEDGPLLYRTTFEQPDPGEGRRAWLTFDGVFYQGDLWVDGVYLGDTEGYFQPHTFEITDQARQRGEHSLAMEVTCARPTDRGAKRNLTGVFQQWDGIDPEWNPGGIWRDVRVETTGPVRIRDLRVLCREASAERAVVVMRANLETVAPRPVTVRSSVLRVTSDAERRMSPHEPGGGVDHELTQSLAAGENHVEWTVTVPEPDLWWPWALGDQPMYDVAVEAWCDGVSSHRRAVSTGLRRVELRNWIATVNGERIFLKGSNVGPTRMALAEATPDDVANDVRLARDAGLDLLRVHAHVARPELYEAADTTGMLLWQDLPLQRGYARGVRKQAVRQAATAVQVLGHHPSIAVWCGHNEPMGTEIPSDHAGRALAVHQLPTWNRSILDRSIKRALETADGTRPVVAHSGVLPHPPQFDGTDSHLYFGWYWGVDHDFERMCAAVPRLARFVSEFGAQAVPSDAPFCAPQRWPDLDWEHLAARHGLQKEHFDRYVPPDEYSSFARWVEATQRYQASVIRHHVEALRRIKYAPTGGFAQFFLADCMPAVSCAVLDDQRRPKLAYGALASACDPVIVVADRPPPMVVAGERIELDVHVVSDLRRELRGCAVAAELRAADGSAQTWRFGGDVPPDSCVHVGTLRAIAPAVAGPLTLHLTLDGPVHATNAYESFVES